MVEAPTFVEFSSRVCVARGFEIREKFVAKRCIRSICVVSSIYIHSAIQNVLSHILSCSLLSCKTDSINSAVRAISEQIQLTGLQHPSLVAESRMDVIYQMTLENNNNFASLIEPNSMELARGPMMNYLRDVCTNETAGLYIKSERNNYVNWVSDGWEAESKRKGKHCKGGAAIDDDDDDIHITFLDDDNREVKKMKIGRSQKLKLLFNGYAEEVGVSLRSLRFSYEGKALFLSSAGSMTPADMDMNDLSFITVTDTTKASDGEESTMSASFSTFNINDSSSHKKGKGKSKKGKSKKNKTPK